MHSSQDQDDCPNFNTQGLDHGLRGLQCPEYPQRIYGIPDIDEIEPDHEQLIYAVGQALIAVENIDQENAAVLKQGTGNPDGQDNRNGQVNGVRKDEVVHG